MFVGLSGCRLVASNGESQPLSWGTGQPCIENRAKHEPWASWNKDGMVNVNVVNKPREYTVLVPDEVQLYISPVSYKNYF